MLGAAAADGFLVDRAWLVGIKTLGHAYAADMEALSSTVSLFLSATVLVT